MRNGLTEVPFYLSIATLLTRVTKKREVVVFIMMFAVAVAVLELECFYWGTIMALYSF
jgi:heme/copper-type cytochrome/quinol oxidase subunit 4